MSNNLRAPITSMLGKTNNSKQANTPVKFKAIWMFDPKKKAMIKITAKILRVATAVLG